MICNSSYTDDRVSGIGWWLERLAQDQVLALVMLSARCEHKLLT